MQEKIFPKILIINPFKHRRTFKTGMDFDRLRRINFKKMTTRLRKLKNTLS